MLRCGGLILRSFADSDSITRLGLGFLKFWSLSFNLFWIINNKSEDVLVDLRVWNKLKRLWEFSRIGLFYWEKIPNINWFILLRTKLNGCRVLALECCKEEKKHIGDNSIYLIWYINIQIEEYLLK